jgi:hypothetical protein
LREKGRGESRDLCLSRIVDAATWLAELEERILLLSVELERFRELIKSIGVDLGLDS